MEIANHGKHFGLKGSTKIRVNDRPKIISESCERGRVKICKQTEKVLLKKSLSCVNFNMSRA